MAGVFYCSGCGEIQPVDGHWRELRVSFRGNLVVSAPFEPVLGGCYETLACGQGSALVLIERYLQSGTFEPAQAHNPQPQPEGEPAR